MGNTGSDLSHTMQDTLLANIGCLAVFQVAGADARTLVWELGKDRVSEDDITSLPVHQCYVRGTVGEERMPAFSMKVRKPDEGEPEIAVRIRAAASSYTTPVKETATKEAESEVLVEKYRAGIEALEKGEAPKSSNGAAPKPAKRRRQRSRKPKDDVGQEAEATEENVSPRSPSEKHGWRVFGGMMGPAQ